MAVGLAISKLVMRCVAFGCSVICLAFAARACTYAAIPISTGPQVAGACVSIIWIPISILIASKLSYMPHLCIEFGIWVLFLIGDVTGFLYGIGNYQRGLGGWTDVDPNQPSNIVAGPFAPNARVKQFGVYLIVGSVFGAVSVLIHFALFVIIMKEKSLERAAALASRRFRHHQKTASDPDRGHEMTYAQGTAAPNYPTLRTA